MKKGKSLYFLFLLLFILFTPETAYADIGPKPSVQIDFTGAEDQVYYATLLSETSDLGPWRAWDGKASDAYDQTAPDYAIWETFVNYTDSDGFFFVQEFWDCTETDNLSWTYYPPNPFKILVYFPETGMFISSEIYERYAFDSYYTVDLNVSDGKLLAAEKNYDYTWEIISLAVRIIATVILEIGIAWLFGYRNASTLRFIICINIITQVLLNVILNITAYAAGSMAFVLNYVLLEILVLVTESICYSRKLPKLYSYGKGRAIIYAFIANIASFGVGLQLARMIPGIF